MRWADQTIQVDDGALPGLGRDDLVRTVTTPEFAGITFHEVLCRSLLNPVPVSSGMPFRFSINTFRGCTHACRYCFARSTHTYLDFDAGEDFDKQIVVKLNAAAVLRKELRRRSWQREVVALGTNTDPYQRAEGRYRLMPPVIGALASSGTPFSILTKGTLLARDLPLLRQAADVVDVSVSVSLSMVDGELAGQLDPGAPSPRARLALIREIADAGLAPHVMVAPVVPYLTDSTAQLDALLAGLAAAGAVSVSAIPMHLRPGAREWFLQWLADEHPALLRRYRALYGRGSYVSAEYSARLADRLRPLVSHHGLAGRSGPVSDVAPAVVATVASRPATMAEPTLF
ncbi:MAG TPA: Rv2578c family radical SAM protein [Gordonia sp. (in: high G+C Gram-positive bacteria)]|uniref:Rv2578c family radical SAM protein n=1 Tax=unclassified Gordonia (in: high G+C Gram-positive bacteria) TaxID=2657482 RepID=UPI000F9F7822|nr:MULTISPECIES: Rv2578c family radical SAM protein [unclassified Gordonia (in: high G+C Gram-positive bacteria)]RUP37751.1 MAG: radical SAM protein [Gordonia sp. (in: high G+C Gram-positive bacteria)]HNP55405.1 Rv2578c family radical SAM protein [Gordonia sp. (in: high G+C Gram-positive bacteria)]HRC51563.1 Rv2578c family radical SAM protein [Gordonia sp. (in: high G+C Gram-positive bacteria)]